MLDGEVGGRILNKSCDECKYFSALHGICRKHLADELESRDMDMSNCPEFVEDEFCI